MLQEFLAGSGAQSLVSYLHLPETRWAVLAPGLASLVILGFYARRGKVSSRLRLLWVLALVVSFFCARWQIGPEVEQLYIYSAFSVLCALLVFRRVYVPPPLAFALTFLALWCVDVARALCRALEYGSPLEQFYWGVGGAGARDGLLLVPLMTAAAVAYGIARIRSRGERMAEL